MSSSSTTACSRSPSPATPATPESSDNLDTVVTQEDLAAWCHSLSPAGFLIGEEFTDVIKKREEHSLDIGDIAEDDTMADGSTPSGPDAHSKFLSSRSPSLSLPMGIEVADLLHTRNTTCLTKPIPPPLSQLRRDPGAGSQCVVYPPKESCYNLPIMIPSIPEGGTKSRVETQVRLTVDLAHASASSGEPLKYDRVGSWKWLRLPKGTSTKRRARKEAKVDAPLEDTLHLTTEVTCASPPHTRVTCCSSCQGREAKRVARKLAARVRPARSDSDSPDDVAVIPGRGKHEDTSNLIQFNCPEVLDFSSGSVVLPLRITCYCRHHREKVGFNVHFTMLDHNGRVVGSGTTRPIMITDDHKSTGVNAKSAAAKDIETSPNPDWPYGSVGDPAEPISASKRKNSRIDTGSERTKKRTKPYDNAGRAGKLRRKGSNGSLNSTPSPATTSAVVTRAHSRASTPAQALLSSPLQGFDSGQSSSEAIDPASAEVAASILSAAFDVPLTPAEHAAVATFEDIVMPDIQSRLDLSHIDPQTISLEELTHPSYLNTEHSAPMPLSLDPAQTLNVDPSSVPFMLFSHDPPPPHITLPIPKIHRLIPAQGPTYGGVEVTVLGSNFHPAMQLNCVFGDVVSSSTQRWSENTLVCLLPPSATPGVVAVWFDGIQKEEDGTPPCLFAYTDETDRALMELALQVVGLKMTGKIEDARNVAMRIVSTTGGDESQNGMDTNTMPMSSPGSTFDPRHLLLRRARDSGDFQKMILDFLAVLDVPMDVPTAPLAETISHPTASGQTLLHLATFLNFPTAVEFLLDHDIDIDARDKNGYTAMHFAGMMKATQCARLLVEAGAAMDVVNALGKTPEEVAPAGFFASIFDDSCSERDWPLDEQAEDEAIFADVEEEDSDAEISVRSYQRYRSSRTHARRKAKPAYRSSQADAKGPEEPSPPTPPDSKSNKAAEAAGVVDEKQVMATIMDMVQRTLAQLQHPQGMIPHMPNLPRPQLPHLRGMPAWGALPQMPAVFPVYVPISALPLPALPIPALSAIWGDKRPEQQLGDDAGDKSVRHQQWLGLPTGPQEWRAIWEKMTMRPTDEAVDAPPAYTPREGDDIQGDVKVEDTAQPSTSAIAPQPLSVTERVSSRRVEYEEVPIPEQEVNSYGYRPVKKQTRRTQKKHDRMLVLFWIPILLIGVIWAFLHAMRVGFHTMRTVLSFDTTLRA